MVGKTFRKKIGFNEYMVVEYGKSYETGGRMVILKDLEATYRSIITISYEKFKDDFEQIK